MKKGIGLGIGLGIIVGASCTYVGVNYGSKMVSKDCIQSTALKSVKQQTTGQSSVQVKGVRKIR